MKKTFLLTLLLCISFAVFALEPAIKGSVVDATNRQPLDFVNISLFRDGSNKAIKTAISDKNGRFQFSNIERGNYVVRISFLGYKPFSKECVFKASSLDLGQIILHENSTNLKEVQVTGQSAQVRFDVDKKIYGVDKAIVAAGGSATEILRTLPSVKVDNEGNVSLRKDQNVEIWINGKPSGLTAENRAQVLQQMPAESVESVEIMTNPSAKFNPEGTAGVINLVLKKNRKAGYYGSITAGVTYPDGGKVTPNGSASINYSSSKFDAYANVGYRAMSFKGGSATTRKNFNLLDTTLLTQSTMMQNDFSGLFMRAGIDYRLNGSNTISLSGFGMAGGSGSQNEINNTLTSFGTKDTLRDYKRTITGTGTSPNFNVTMDYRHDFDKKGDNNLQSSISYSNYKRSGNNSYLQPNLPSPKDSVNQTNTSQSNDITFKVDYTNKFSQSSRLEAGWQSTISNRFSKAGAIYISNKDSIKPYQNEFDYSEQIHAGYVTYGDRIDKLSLQGGLRAEYFNRDCALWTPASGYLPTVSKSSFQLFPSFYASYTLAEGNELQLNYSKRVNRPRGRRLSSFRDYSDSTNISYGNPNLVPEYASAFELNYLKSWTNHSLMASAYYRFTNNVIENVRFRNGGTMENTYMNLSKRENMGVELTAKNQLFRILNLTSTLNLYYQKLDSSVYADVYNPTITTTIPAQSQFTWSANVMANFMLSKTLSGQITGEYSAPSLIAQGTERPEYSIDLGLRKTFLDRRLTVGFIARDLFNMNKERTITWGNGFYQVSESYFHRRMLGITATWNFGTIKPKPAEMKKRQGDSNMMDGEME